jgi:hypothetical protein
MRSDFTSSSKGATIMKTTTVGMDLAKHVFQAHGVDAGQSGIAQEAGAVHERLSGKNAAQPQFD